MVAIFTYTKYHLNQSRQNDNIREVIDILSRIIDKILNCKNYERNNYVRLLH